jgi:hypothetical protein
MARYTVVEASTKSGKTVACAVWILEQAMRGHPGQNFWWVAPTYPVARVAFTRLVRWLQLSGLPRAAWSHSLGDTTIHLWNGATIWFKGSDAADNLYGFDPDTRKLVTVNLVTQTVEQVRGRIVAPRRQSDLGRRRVHARGCRVGTVPSRGQTHRSTRRHHTEVPAARPGRRIR